MLHIFKMGNFVFLLIFGLIGYAAFANKMKIECERRCHASLNAQQRANICNQEEYSLGPAACSVMAKEALHLRYEDIYKLCHEAPSAAPVECMMKLEVKDRSELGYNICTKAISTVPSECFRRILSMGKAPKKTVALFCQSNLDHAPDLCVKAAHDYLGMKVEDALSICQDAVGSSDASLTNPRNSVISECILKLKDYNKNGYGLKSKDIVQFCSKINPNQYVDMVNEETFPVFASAATDCFLQLVEDFPESSLKLSYNDMLTICQNAPLALGPTNCTKHVSKVVAIREPHLKLSAEAVTTLCQGAMSEAPGDCFAESKGLGTLEERAVLCNSASNSGPAACYRRSSAVFKSYPEEHRALCLLAESEGPAECAAAAPHYLVAEEKVHLCTNAPVTGYNDPIKCLQTVHTYSKNFQNAPKRALGYFQENLLLDSEWTSRALLVSMCSYSDSQDPAAAAECYKSVPTSLQHDDAVRLCTNISSSHAIQHIQLCQRILPKTWSSEAISYLCEGLETRIQTESIVKCAIELAKTMQLYHHGSQPHGKLLDSLDIAKLCRSETPSQGVLRCVQRVAQLPPTATTLLLPHSATTISTLCQHAQTTHSAECIHEMAKISTASNGFAPNITEKLCTRSDYASILICLSHMKHKRLWDTNDILKCAEEKRTLSSIKVKRIYSWENDNLQIMAGKRFALWFDVFDQWQQKYEYEDSDKDKSPILKISINENNAAGAILWGYRTNTTHNGMLYFHSLIISQPGMLEVRISVTPSSSSSSSISGREKEQTLAIFKLEVVEDPVAKETAPCIYALKHGICPHDADGADHDAIFPQARSYSPALPFNSASHGSYLHHLYCVGEKLAHWGIKSYMLADGSLHLDYRSGLDSIWTGIGLPRYEMSPEQKLGLILPSEIVQQHHAWETSGSNVQPSSLSKALTRLIKRAYYRSSLQWHPDRWSGNELEQYKPIVQGIFQQITEAYEQCQERWLRSSTNNKGSSDTAGGESEAPVQTPVYE